MMKDKIKHI